MSRIEPWSPVALHGADDASPGLWTAAKWSKDGWHWRSVALALPAGGTLVYSPIRRLGDEALAALEAIGAPAILLAPNHFHYLGLGEYAARWPDVHIAASAKAAARIAKKAQLATPPVAIDSDAFAALAPQLPAQVSPLVPPGLRTGEVWLRIAAGDHVAWVVSDAFFHLAQHARGFIGAILRLTGTTHGLRIGRTFTGLAVHGRQYRDWLAAQIDADAPTTLIPSHGEIVRGDDLPARLRALVEARL